MIFHLEHVYSSYPNYMDIFHDVFVFMNYVMKSSLHVYFFTFEKLSDVVPDIHKTYSEDDISEIDACTFIMDSDINKFPTKSNIHISNELFKEKERTQLKYTIIHELIHAHGIMCSANSKWSEMCSNNTHNKESCLYQKKIQEDGNHILGWKDCFSSYVRKKLHYRTLQLLHEYGYKVRFENLNPIIARKFLNS